MRPMIRAEMKAFWRQMRQDQIRIVKLPGELDTTALDVFGIAARSAFNCLGEMPLPMNDDELLEYSAKMGKAAYCAMSCDFITYVVFRNAYRIADEEYDRRWTQRKIVTAVSVKDTVGTYFCADITRYQSTFKQSVQCFHYISKYARNVELMHHLKDTYNVQVAFRYW